MMDDPEGMGGDETGVYFKPDNKASELKIYFKPDGEEEFVELGNLRALRVVDDARSRGCKIDVRFGVCNMDIADLWAGEDAGTVVCDEIPATKRVHLPVMGGVDNCTGAVVEVIVPIWARYAAQDSNGNWWAYSDEPVKTEYLGWDLDGDSLDAMYVMRGGKNPDYWEESLLRIL